MVNVVRAPVAVTVLRVPARSIQCSEMLGPMPSGGAHVNACADGSSARLGSAPGIQEGTPADREPQQISRSS